MRTTCSPPSNDATRASSWKFFADAFELNVRGLSTFSATCSPVITCLAV
ncbi:MAG TPA: hypothetical protein VFS00_24530 [Polyangiaceae bacterium]|nr:hypothetical protein [Polyangiaceae bacterium]